MIALGDATVLRDQFRGVIEMVYAKHYDFQSQCMNETKGGDFRFSRVCTLIFVAMSLYIGILLGFLIIFVFRL